MGLQLQSMYDWGRGQWFMDKDRPITSDPANRDGCSKGIKGGCQTLADVMRESGCGVIIAGGICR